MDYATVLEMMRTRRSVRKFTPREPSRADVERIVDAARWAPSNHNRQAWKFIVFTGRAELRGLAERVRAVLADHMAMLPRITPERRAELLDHATVFADAPCVILVMHKHPSAVGRNLRAGAEGPALASGEPLSAAMAVQNMLLAAHSLGMGACVHTAALLAGEVWRNLTDRPAGFVPTCLVALGYADEQPDAPRKKTLDHILEYR